MKKILLLLMIFPIIINADHNWTNNLPINKNINIIESEIRYKWYKEEKYNISYVRRNECNCEYLNLNDYKYNNLTGSDNIENEDIITEISKKTFDVDKVKYILLSDFDIEITSNLKEIIVYRKFTNIKIKYEIIEANNIEGNITELFDGIYHNGITINKESSILLALEEEYDSNSISIFLYENNNLPANLKLKINLMLEKNYITKYKEITNEMYCPSSSYCITEIYPNNTWTTKSEFLIYNYKEKIYECYDKKRIYLNDYYVDKINYIKDEDNYLIYYKYKEVKKDTSNIALYSEMPIINEEKNNKEDYISSGVINDQITLNTDNIIEKENKNWIIFLIVFVVINIILGLICYICRKIGKIDE